MDIDIFLKPIDHQKIEIKKNSFGDLISSYTTPGDIPSIEQVDLCIIGVLEDRGTINNKGCALAPDEIRAQLYALYPNFHAEAKIADLGNIHPGKTLSDTYFAVSEVVSYLHQNNITVIILGGSQDITFANYLAYQKQEKIINLVCIDRKLDINNTKEICADNFVNKIILHQPNFLFNFSNIGFQTYFDSQQSIDLMQKMHFDLFRLGEINKENIKEVEPVLRNTDMVSIDLSAVRASDAPATAFSSPNGLYGEELCQLTWYCGLSDKVSSIGFYETNITLDKKKQSTHLIAQSIWYFISGYYKRRKESPINDKENFLTFRVIIEEGGQEITFLKSTISDRWWMQVPYPTNEEHRYASQQLVPCSYSDYQKACNEDIPERWWKTFQKLL